jgi:hypothetical protein
VSVNRDERIASSKTKVLPPFELDLSLRFYSPQDNLDAFEHPLISAFHEFLLHEYVPALPEGQAILLLLPCTRTKPYPASTEHRGINAALLRAGFRPSGGVPTPFALERVLEANEDPSLLDTSPLIRDGTVLHRMVVSEPMGVVPYEHAYWWRGVPSPAAQYDDPGLFEARGTSVSPWRSDSTARPSSRRGKWLWGDGERYAYAAVHNRLSQLIAAAISRIAGRYETRLAWVAPGLTHRSFLASSSMRRAERLPSYREVAGQRIPLVGVNDIAPELVDIHPSRAEIDDSLVRLGIRLRAERGSVSRASVLAHFARGGRAATPIVLPELLTHLMALVAPDDASLR